MIVSQCPGFSDVCHEDCLSAASNVRFIPYFILIFFTSQFHINSKSYSYTQKVTSNCFTKCPFLSWQQFLAKMILFFGNFLRTSHTYALIRILDLCSLLGIAVRTICLFLIFFQIDHHRKLK